MFLAEVAAGFVAGSVSLQADALDFLGDAFNYGISLAVVGLALSWRARAALFKGITMTLFGLWVIGTTAWHIAYGVVPEPYVMGAIGTLALAANGAVALMLYRFRECVRFGCAPAMTCLEISPCCSLPWVCSEQAPCGPTSSWRLQWLA